jgi:hypothetical protein
MKGTLGRNQADAVSRNTLHSYVFMNYASSFQNPIDSYGAENKLKLQEVSEKYDPEGVFQKGVPGGFKVFD